MAVKKTKRGKPIKNRGKGRGKACEFCKGKREPVWQEYEKLGEYLSPRARILSSQISGVCNKHQKKLGKIIKQLRHLGLLPFVNQE
jgi:small subunit ribosomal protein S18